MAARITRAGCILDTLLILIFFENAENFGESTKERSDYTFPMDMHCIAEMQDTDNLLLAEIKKDNDKYELQKIEWTLVLMRDGNMCIPTAVPKCVMVGYLCHPGSTCTYANICSTMMWPGLTKDVQSHCRK
jgi:hypothetical protein